jgi:hypothetical protein
MKKTIFATLLAVMMLMGFSSCKKDWSCACTDQNGNTIHTAINNETFLNATAKCKNMSFNVGGASESCSL